MKVVTQKETLLQMYLTINGPVKVGKKWVTYRREQVDAVLVVAKQLLELEGYEFEESTNEN